MVTRNSDINAIASASPFNKIEEIWETNRPEDMIAQIAPRPFLMIYSSDDKRITSEEAMRLYTAAQGPKRMWLVEGPGYGEVPSLVLEHPIMDIMVFFEDSFQTPPSRGSVNSWASCGFDG